MPRYLQTIFFSMGLVGLALVVSAVLLVPAPVFSVNTPRAIATAGPPPPPITSPVFAGYPTFEKIVNLGVPAGNSTTPQHLALDGRAGQIYIFSSGVPFLKQGNSIAGYNIKTGEFTSLTRINEGAPRPLDLHFDPHSGLLLALWDPDYGSDQPRTLSIVQPNTGQVVQEIPQVQAMAVAGGLLYTTAENRLAIWPNRGGRFVKQQETDLSPALQRGPIAVNPATNRMYVARTTDQTMTLEIFAADTLTPLGTYQTDGPILNILPQPTTGEVFLVEAVNDNRMLQRLSANGRPLAPPYELGPRRGDGITLSPDGNMLYFSNGELPPFEPESGDNTGPALIGLQTSDLALQHDIPLPTNFDDVVIDPITHQAFAVYPYDHLLYVIDLTADTAANVYTAITIRDVLADEKSNQLYVTDTGQRVRRLDAETFATLAEIRLDQIYRAGQTGQAAGELALDRTRNRLYVSGQPAFVLAADTLELIKILDPGGQFAPNPAGDKVYFSHCGITLLAAATLTGTTLLPGSGPRDDQFSPNPCVNHSRLDSANQLLYSLATNGTPGSNSGNYLYVYDLAQPTLIFTDTNIHITQVVPDPQQRRAFVSHTRHSFRQLRTLVVPPAGPINYTHQLFSAGGQTAYSPATNRLYISDNYRLLALAADTLNVSGEMPLPPGYDYQVVALHPATERVYLAGFDGQLLVAQGYGGATRVENLANLQAAGGSTPPVYTPTGKILQLESTANDHLIARIDTAEAGPRLFKSTDGGQMWLDLNRTLPPFGVEALAVSPHYADDHPLFAGLGLFGSTGGIYTSTDAGQTWQAALTGLRDLGTSRLFISPDFGSNDQLIFADTAYAGLHASANGGQSWLPLIRPNPNTASFSSGEGAVAINSEGVILAGQIVGDMAGVFQTTFNPNRNLSGWQQVLDTYLSLLAFAPEGQTALGFGTTSWRSTDSGLTWAPGGAGLTDLDRFEAKRFLFSPSFAHDQTAYLFFTDIRGEESCRLYRSTDGGQNWQLWSAPPGDNVLTAVTLAANGDFLFGDDQTGVTRVPPEALTWLAPELPSPPFPVDDLAVSPAYAQDQTLFAISHAHGLFKSTTGGQNWQLTNFPVRSTSFDGYRLGISPHFGQDQTLYVATGFSLHRSLDGGQTWKHLLWQGLNLPAETIAISPNTNTLLVSTPAGIWRSTNGDQNWQEVLAKPPDAGPARVLTFTPSGAMAYAWFDYHTAVYTGVNDGQSWQASPAPPDSYVAVSGGTIDPHDNLILATEFPFQLWKIANQGHDWQLFTDTLPAGLNNVQTMAYTAAGDLWLGGQGGIFAGSNDGQNWQSRHRGLSTQADVRLLRSVAEGLFMVLQDGTILMSVDEKTWFDVSLIP